MNFSKIVAVAILFLGTIFFKLELSQVEALPVASVVEEVSSILEDALSGAFSFMTLPLIAPQKIIEYLSTSDKFNSILQQIQDLLRLVDSGPLRQMLDNLEDDVIADVIKQDVISSTLKLLKQIISHSIEDVTALFTDPSNASKKIIENLITDFTEIVTEGEKYVTIIENRIQDPIYGLVDSGPLGQILDNLRDNVVADVIKQDVISSTLKLLKQIISHSIQDVTALFTDPSNASKKIIENLDTDFNEIVTEGEKYVAIIQNRIQDPIYQISQLLNQ